MTPRLKTSGMRSPIMLTHYETPKRATSLVEIDPLDFMNEP
jgi:hypothetical protein